MKQKSTIKMGTIYLLKSVMVTKSQQPSTLENYANKSSKLTQELNQRLAIQNLWPEAFDRGKAKSQWIGRLRMQTDDPLDALEKFIIINGAGEKRVFDAETALNAGVSPPNFYI